MKSVQCSHCLCSLPETPYGCSGYSAVLLSCVRRSRAFRRGDWLRKCSSKGGPSCGSRREPAAELLTSKIVTGDGFRAVECSREGPFRGKMRGGT